MRGKIRLDGRKHTETKKGFPIVIYLTKDRKEKIILTGFHSKKEHWDKVNALPLKKHPEYLEVLNYLEVKKIKLKQLLINARTNSTSFSYAERFLKGEGNDIFYKDAIEIVKDLQRPYTTVLNSFNSYYKDYPYSLITKQIATEYMNKLLNTPVNGKKRSPNGVLSYMDSLTATWNKLERPNNPFSGVKPKAVPTKNKAFTDDDLMILKNNPYKKHKSSKIGGKYNYINYLMLCFYLGGIDLVDLKNMRYDKNVVNGRIEFNRSKGSTNVFVSNKIFPEAFDILEIYDCKPYLVPLFNLKNYDGFIPNMSRDFKQMQEFMGLSKKPYSKAPRYTFITRAQNLLIDERCAMALVGHSQSSTHSIYKDEFPRVIKDAAHKKIIDLNIKCLSFDDV